MDVYVKDHAMAYGTELVTLPVLNLTQPITMLKTNYTHYLHISKY
jgi:hypothetical protein